MRAILLLFSFKQIITDSIKSCASMKLHLLFHLPQWIRLYGSPLGLDTERWENFLSLSAKKIWKQSKKSTTDFMSNMLMKLLETTSGNTLYNLDESTVVDEDDNDHAVPLLTRLDIQRGKSYNFEKYGTTSNKHEISATILVDGTFSLCLVEEWPLDYYLPWDLFVSSLRRYIDSFGGDWNAIGSDLDNGRLIMSLVSSVKAGEESVGSRKLKLHSLYSKPKVVIYCNIFVTLGRHLVSLKFIQRIAITMPSCLPLSVKLTRLTAHTIYL